MAPAPSPSTESFTPDPRRWLILGVLMVALFMSLIDVSIVNVALPSIQLGLDASQSQLQWVLSGYALAFGVGLVAAGRAGDIYGRGALFITGVAIFTASSIACGLAQDANLLNVARAFQGIGSGLLNPQAVGMIQQHFRGEERGRAFGFFGAAVGVSVAIGPVLGGLLIKLAGMEHGWRWVFFVNLPVGIAAIALAARFFPKPLFDKQPVHGARAPSVIRDLDPGGAVLLGLAVFAMLLPFVETGAGVWMWVSLPVGLALLALWLWWERRQKRRDRNPMVDLDIFHVASFANGTLLVSLYFVGITSVWVLLALYMQDGLGHTALAAGLIGLPSAILSGLAALWSGRHVHRLGRGLVVGGLYVALVGLGTSILVVWLRSLGMASEWWLLLTLSFIGVAQGMVISPNQTLTLADVPLSYAGSSGGIMQTGQRIGTSVGIAVITALAFKVLSSNGWSWAFISGFAAIMVVVVLTLFVAYRDLQLRRRQAA